ncbi:putative SAC3/GANP/Rpn12p [Cryptosporidium canis]|uniref:SAC3/GANP/Rpn12p n=1 Tax=Cryptosporidium canis TaxID=195482 RepID=A0A9D5DHD6_9CRYT|nr:putative SAC3/GANP/Rpn12p [Cryptosporidium canis]
MSQQSTTGQTSLIAGFRVGSKATRGWNQPDSTAQGCLAVQSQGIVDKENPNTNAQMDPASAQKSMEDWYKAHYYDYYFKAYKSNGLDDLTSSQYAHSCVGELERTGYIQRIVQSQNEAGAREASGPRDFRDQRQKPQRSSGLDCQTGPPKNTLNGVNSGSKGIQNWLYRLFSAYRSDGTSKDDIEWNQKLFSYSKYVTERFKISNKTIDWSCQSLPKREVIQNFRLEDHGGPVSGDSLNVAPASPASPSSRSRFSGPIESELKNGEEACSSYFGETDFIPLRSKRTRDSPGIEGGKAKYLKQRKHVSNPQHGFSSPGLFAGQESKPKCCSSFVAGQAPLDSEPSVSSPKEPEECGYILDANGNRRLSWQQILALGRSTEKIVGLSTDLEKQYLRLTSCPDPNLVRPESVLKKSLDFVYGNYLNYSSSQASSSSQKQKKYDWKYLEEQFRSIRQDLTVQGIKNLFTIQVYELNARVALENHDLGQFNQCQTRLKELYSLGLVEFEHSNREEFLCYYIIYVALQNMNTDLIRVLDEAHPYRNYGGISFAMQVCKALMEGNFCRYFKLCKKAPWNSKFLFEIFRNRQLINALTAMTKAFRFIEISALASSLGFESNQECHSFLVSQNAVFVNPDSPVNEMKLDCKASFPVFSSSPLLLNRKVQALG